MKTSVNYIRRRKISTNSLITQTIYSPSLVLRPFKIAAYIHGQFAHLFFFPFIQINKVACVDNYKKIIEVT